MTDKDMLALVVPLSGNSADVPTMRGERHAAEDERRLMLHMALTVSGVPPAPEDTHTIRKLAELDGVEVRTVVRWLRHAAGGDEFGAASASSESKWVLDVTGGLGLDQVERLGELSDRDDVRETPSKPGKTDAVPEEPRPPGPASVVDPRLMSW